MGTYDIPTLVSVARSLSPFYRQLYEEIPLTGWQLQDLPLIDHTEFWQANTTDDNRLLTGPMSDGVVFKSGGTTGSPKFTVFTKSEWATLTDVYGRSMVHSGLAPKDRVANLFYGGQLYASFLFANDFLACCPIKVLHFPISGMAPIDFIVKNLQDFRINVLFGVPTTMINLAEYVRDHNIRNLCIEKIYFAGETMYEDQRQMVSDTFPGVVIRSIGYASNDGGMIAYADQSCGFNEHRVCDEYCELEIIDETSGQPIDTLEQEGRIIITDKARLLMPVIRYPAGDRGYWLEPPGTPDRKFLLLGRSEEGARIGTMTLNAEDVWQVLRTFKDRLHLANFQMVITRSDRRDCLTLRLASACPTALQAQAEQELREQIYAARPMFDDLLAQNIIHPLQFEWVLPQQLTVNERTGKLRRIIDQRFGG